MAEITTDDSLELVIGDTDPQHIHPAPAFAANFVKLGEANDLRMAEIEAVQATAEATEATAEATAAVLATEISRAQTAEAAVLNPTDVGYDVILLAGQSNMSGRGAAYDLTRYDPIDPRIFQYGNSGTYANVISQAVEPLAMHDTPSGMGPGIVFARWYLGTIPTPSPRAVSPCGPRRNRFQHRAQ